MKDSGGRMSKAHMAFVTVTLLLNYFSSITYPLGFLSSSVSTVWSTYSNTKWSFFFRLKTSIKFTKFWCFNCWKGKRTIRDKNSRETNKEFVIIYNTDYNSNLMKQVKWMIISWFWELFHTKHESRLFLIHV